TSKPSSSNIFFKLSLEIFKVFALIVKCGVSLLLFKSSSVNSSPCLFNHSSTIQRGWEYFIDKNSDKLPFLSGYFIASLFLDIFLKPPFTYLLLAAFPYLFASLTLSLQAEDTGIMSVNII